MKLRIAQIDVLYYVQHIGGRVFCFNYASASDAHDLKDELNSAWASNEYMETPDLQFNFVEDIRKCILWAPRCNLELALVN